MIQRSHARLKFYVLLNAFLLKGNKNVVIEPDFDVIIFKPLTEIMGKHLFSRAKVFGGL
jgi:hypothetical protein